MQKQFLFLIGLFIFLTNIYSQTATFITLDDIGNLYRVSVSSGSCTNTALNLCNNFTGNPLSIALDGNKLYIVDNQGFLYKSTLNNAGTANNCTKIGSFPTTTAINGLTVGNGGIVYAASGSKIESYNPATNKFSSLGSIPSQWTIGGDLLFYKGVLYEAVKINNSATNCALIEINLSNISSSTLYMNFNAGTNAFGFASVTVPCSNNQAYALSNGTSTTKIYAIDMTAKTEATTATCTLNYNVYDAASIAETQTANPPADPVVTSPVNYCVGQAVTPLTVNVNAPDTLRWYKQAVGGISYGSPTPAVSSANVSSTDYYVSNFDTSTGCESGRSLIKVIINPYPSIPSINPNGTNTICASDSIKLTSSANSNNQWYINGNPIISATNQTYFANTAGNYTVSTTGVGGCSKTSIATTLNITNAAISYTGSPFCNTGTAAVTQAGETGGFYTASPSGLSIDVNTGEINLAASNIGIYTITYTVGVANCNFTTNIEVIHTTASISYASNQFCKSSPTQNVILATGSATGGNFSATPSGLNINGVTGAITPSLSNVDTYTITYTYGILGVGCSVQTTTTTLSISDTAKTIVNKSICNGDSILFNGNYYKTAGTYTYKTNNLNGCISLEILNLNILTSSTSNTSKSICNGDSILFNGNYYKTAGTYSYKTTNINGCDSIATLTLNILNKTSSNTTKSICNGDSILFNGNYYKTTGTYSYKTANINGCDSIATLTLNVLSKTSSSTSKTICKGDTFLFNGVYYTNPSTYSATLTNAIGCDSIATLVLSVEDFKITLSATPNPINAATNLLASISSNTTIASSVWQPSSLFTNNLSNQTIKAPYNNFVIKVNAISANGCVDSANSAITIKLENENVYIPNAFIPFDTRNAENRTLKVYGNFIKNASLDIYNQWGEKIASLNDATNIGWDGTVNGNKQSVDVYIYCAKILLKNNKEIIKKGTVNLVR